MSKTQDEIIEDEDLLASMTTGELKVLRAFTGEGQNFSGTEISHKFSHKYRRLSTFTCNGLVCWKYGRYAVTPRGHKLAGMARALQEVMKRITNA